MRVLVVGAGGFIGARLVVELLARGHQVLPAGRDAAALRRRFPGSPPLAADLARDEAAGWAARLAGVDAVVNAAGALAGDLEALHASGPAALFEACAAAGIPKVLQISALGAATGGSRFLDTKRAADDRLLALRAAGGRQGWAVLRPSLVIGRGGGSTGLFAALAVLPVPLRLARGDWPVQPLHVADLVRAIAELLERPALPPVLDLVGPAPMGTDGLTASLRDWLGRPPRPPLALPEALLRGAAALGRFLPGSPLTPATLGMLARGNTADPGPAAAVLGWTPRPLPHALAAEPAVAADLLQARAVLARPLLRVALATVWIGTAIVSVLPGSLAASHAMLARLGLRGGVADLALYGGAALDLLVGLAVLALPRRTLAVGLLQLGVMALFTLLASLAAPGAWADPFGPLLKNAAIAGAVLALLALRE